MCTFHFRYTSGDTHVFEHITKAEFMRSNLVTVTEKDLLSFRFPTGYDLHLFSETNNFTVSGKDLTYIEVKKEG